MAVFSPEDVAAMAQNMGGGAPAPAPIAAPVAQQGMAAAPGFAELRAELEALRTQTSAGAVAAEKAARLAADPERARYPVVDTPDKLKAARKDLEAQGLNDEQIEKKLAKFKKKGGKIKTSAKLLKVGRILGDTLAGYNPRGYQPGQPTAQISQQHRARIETAGAIARQQAMESGDQQAQLLLTEAQYGLEQTAKMAKEERDAQRKTEDKEWELVSRDRMVARDLGIPDYMGDINVIRDQITAARLADAQAESRVKAMEEKYSTTRQKKAELDVVKTQDELRNAPAQARREAKLTDARIANTEASTELTGAQLQEKIDEDIAQIKGEITDPVERRAIASEDRKAEATAVLASRETLAMYRTMTPAKLAERNMQRAAQKLPLIDAQAIATMVMMDLDAAGLIEYDDEGNPVALTPKSQKVMDDLAKVLSRLFAPALE